ncbi:NAD-dependent epimerase/dehydratase family protein [Saccharospirillum alexandrii]|uniref:NAD-dependent epimerase/dehydratase family protein n=1 Tax=Saccharospirillum alexandrii TaxID=2448477 RepID=UPI003735BC95
MKTALIIGITGNFGAQMALALREQGWGIRALMRDPAKAPGWLQPDCVISGSAQDESAVLQAARGADLLVYAANPQYHRWHQEALAMLEPAVRAAEQLKLQLVFPGNVYGYAPQAESVDEQVRMNPPTDKGLIRQQMEQRLHRASEQGAGVLIVRAGDFIGPNTTMTWLDLMASVKGSRVRLKLPHDDQHVHYYSYLPDLCTNTAKLLNGPLLDWEVFHDPGLALSKADWQNAFQSLGVSARMSAFPWWGLRLAALVSPLMKEVMKMRYLWRQPVIMNGEKMIQQLGDRRQATALPVIVRDTLFKP